ncbi:MAG: cytidylyltransferase domain-containing protein [Acidobacteriota bacterium]
MRTVFCVTVRLKSTRLPGKALLDLGGRPMLARQIERIRRARRVDAIVLATSTHPQDDDLETFAAAEGVACLRGDEEDVIQRLSDAATSLEADCLLNITGDCPFVDPRYADRLVEAYEATGADLVRALDLPHGAFSYALRPSALRQVLEIKADRQTEAWGRYFTDTDLFRVHDLVIEPHHRRPDVRITVDYPEDLAVVRAIFERLGGSAAEAPLDAIIDLLDSHPEIRALNRECAARYQRRFAAQSDIQLKPRHQIQRAAIIGCGAIGQRHARNLRSLGITDLVAYRTRRGATGDLDPVLGIREIGAIEAVIDSTPDVAVISNPTAHHVEAALALAPHVKGLFIEKPVAGSLTEARRLASAVAGTRVVTFVGHNLHFHPAIQALLTSARARVGVPLIFQCQVGQWLPDWHPLEDYRRAYFARADLGGGMIRTLSHELHLAIELLGPARRVSCSVAGWPTLPVDVDVSANLQVEHAGGATSHIHLDGVQKTVNRQGTLAGDEGWARYDLLEGQLVVKARGDARAAVTWEGTAYDDNDGYVREMACFLRFVREGRIRHEHDLSRSLATMALIDAALASAQLGGAVSVGESA